MMATEIHAAAHVENGAQLGDGVTVGPGAVIGPNVRIGDRTSVGAHALVTGWTRIGSDVQIHHGAVLGAPPQDLKYRGEQTYLEVGDHSVFREYATVHLGTVAGGVTRIGSHCLLMVAAHVAHDCHVGDHVIIANASQLAGFVTVEDWAIVGGLAGVHQFARVGCHSMLGGGARFIQDVAPYTIVGGAPSRPTGINMIGLERRGVPRETRDALSRSFKLLFRRKLTVVEAATLMRAEHPGVPEVEHLARFAETTVRGLIR
jgi:UDP-N-acetylglucosamine acyltransferase